METAGVPVSSGAGEGVFGAGPRAAAETRTRPRPCRSIRTFKKGGGPPGYCFGAGSGVWHPYGVDSEEYMTASGDLANLCALRKPAHTTNYVSHNRSELQTL